MNHVRGDASGAIRSAALEFFRGFQLDACLFGCQSGLSVGVSLACLLAADITRPAGGNHESPGRPRIPGEGGDKQRGNICIFQRRSRRRPARESIDASRSRRRVKTVQLTSRFCPGAYQKPGRAPIAGTFVCFSKQAIKARDEDETRANQH